ncbi:MULTISPECIES: sulfurtransferase-like selenium metabolism protein YedF [Halanaerobium]|jgi:selenium metabolism protein YedF|uniref:Selenium metabolism protein YedF n=1 Tax=Halanaerobium kushneri TaxID=56779 RepID=A0A1N6TI77_9FIRM|nr:MULTISPECIES: sulfurtransferase-like selenium metabolism protein YedF [Halanaerobium]RCW56227.1 selenium metabolism protein YedF [Halanaerobium sp. ST460_2HS_T2]SIQ52947.1 selenium metabolism protein YedF [Halanaerobium kushneri]
MLEIDARGLACPKPVVKAKKALDNNEKFIVIVDNRTAVENLSKLGQKMKAEISVVEESETEFKVMFKQSEFSSADTLVAGDQTSVSEAGSEAKIYFISSDTMGEGNEELGRILIKGFISTIKDLNPLPEKIIFINSGVKLAILEKDIVAALKELEARGVTILLCGTCVDFYDLKTQMQVGEISNMYEIADSLNSSAVLKI